MDPSHPWQPADWLNRGGESLSHDPRLAQRLLAQGIQGMPQAAIAWFNLGIALHQQRRIAAAIRAYRHALALPQPPVAEASNNLAQDLLLSGRFAEGWPLYERRLHKASYDHTFFKQISGEAWQGFGDPRPCHRLVLVAEQGFGDTLQFCRLALGLPMETVLFSQPALVSLLQRGTALQRVCSEVSADLLDAGTRWCPLLSLPDRLGLNSGTIPLAGGYLRAEPQRVAHWHRQLQRRAGHRLIALHWQGNPKHEGSLYSRGRSMALQHWLPLAQCPGLELVSIQKGPGSEQLQQHPTLPWVAGQAAVSASLDFGDTAAILANCDLLISADSGVVHLAGAMGVPTWVALRWIPEWRWLLEGDNTPWYASVRLFRQPRDGDWASVVQRIVRELG